MKILLSIKPEYAEKILDGEKKFEFRKIIPRIRIKTVIIYATKPVGKIIGEFEIDSFLSDNPDKIWALTSNFSGISEDFFHEYFHGHKTAHAFKIRNAYRYKQPLELKAVLTSGFVPQSFCYLD